MSAVAAACSALAAAAAFVLLRRLSAAGKGARARLASATSPDDFPRAVQRLLDASLDHGLLAEAAAAGLADVPVTSREAKDPYRNAAELVDWLARQAGQTSYAEVCGLIKGVYQLGQTLRCPERPVDECLGPLLGRLRACSVGGSPVGRVEFVRQGAMLNPDTMAAMNYGSRVSQPLGVLIYDPSGKVLGKAKVLCG